MPFEPISPEKVSHAVMRQIERLILQGVLRPGERLPAERELSDRMGVSRPSLREAIAQMQEDGLLIAKPGAGIFVAQSLNAVFPQPLARLIASHPEAVFDYLSFRKDIESMAAERAARHGSDADLALIDLAFQRMETAHQGEDTAEESRQDALFHMAIVEASHNVVMLHMVRSMVDLLHHGVVYNRQQMFRQRVVRAELLQQHRAINEALQARNAAAARDSAAAHITFIEHALQAQQREDEHAQIAQKKLSQSQMK